MPPSTDLIEESPPPPRVVLGDGGSEVPWLWGPISCSTVCQTDLPRLSVKNTTRTHVPVFSPSSESEAVSVVSVALCFFCPECTDELLSILVVDTSDNETKCCVVSTALFSTCWETQTFNFIPSATWIVSLMFSRTMSLLSSVIPSKPSTQKCEEKLKPLLHSTVIASVSNCFIRSASSLTIMVVFQRGLLWANKTNIKQRFQMLSDFFFFAPLTCCTACQARLLPIPHALPHYTTPPYNPHFPPSTSDHQHLPLRADQSLGIQTTMPLLHVHRGTQHRRWTIPWAIIQNPK